MHEQMTGKMCEMMMMGYAMGGSPMVRGATMAAGLAAGSGLVRATLFRNPLVLIAGGIAAGYLFHKYEKEIALALAKASDAGKDFVLKQKESLNDLVAEARQAEADAGTAGKTPQS
jgi:hypothetical protein